MLEVIYRATDLKMQLDTLRMENLDPLQKINKLIELYVTVYITIAKFIFHFEFSSKKRSINLDAFVELKRAI
jgi:hypothetical protein